MRKRIVIIGGGAAGFFCAVNAAKWLPKSQVIIVEKSNKLLSKVRVSGGGRCNVTHSCIDNHLLIKKYPRGSNFLKKIFPQFNTQHTIQWFEERGVVLKTESDGRMFPISNSSQSVIDCLMMEANKYGVQIMMNREVKAVHATSDNHVPSFVLSFADSEQISADYIVIACGGYPKSSMFHWLTSLGHTIENPVPSLFSFNMPGNKIVELMGVSVEKASVKIIGSKLSEEGPLLITHWGMSGPAILKLSAWGARELSEQNYHFNVMVNWTNRYNEEQLRNEWQTIRNQYAAQKIVNRNPFDLPNRLWQYLLAESNIHPEIRWADLPAKEQNKLIKNLTSQTFEVKGKTTFKEEFVTCGGIKLAEINPNKMESRLVPNIYFAGEIVDVDGITGGFNFQNAWSTGWIAAKAISSATTEVMAW